MPGLDDVISFTDAAEEKDCGRTTLWRAANDGRLNTVEVAGRRAIVKDDAYDAFEPEWTGRRAQDRQTDNSDQ
jgi:hypothetical protein